MEEYLLARKIYHVERRKMTRRVIKKIKVLVKKNKRIISFKTYGFVISVFGMILAFRLTDSEIAGLSFAFACVGLLAVCCPADMIS